MPPKYFMTGGLKAHPTVAQHVLFAGEPPLAFIDTAGCGFDEKQEGSGLTNPEEAAFLVRCAARLVAELHDRFPGDDFPTMAIISPYRNQVHLLQELVRAAPILREHGDKITVNTIDSFQGQERDIVYIGMTRSNADSRIGFLSDTRRMNVAMTRARKKTGGHRRQRHPFPCPFLCEFYTYAEQHEAYQKRLGVCRVSGKVCRNFGPHHRCGLPSRASHRSPRGRTAAGGSRSRPCATR